MQQNGLDIELVGIGALFEEVADCAGKPITLSGAVGAAPVAGDGDAEGGPEAQCVPDTEIELF